MEEEDHIDSEGEQNLFSLVVHFFVFERKMGITVVLPADH